MGGTMTRREPPPLHLACALLSACVLSLGAGASCDRQATPESSGTASRTDSPPPRAAADEPAEVPSLDTKPLAPFTGESEPGHDGAAVKDADGGPDGAPAAAP